MKEASNKNSPAGFHAEVPRLRTHFCGPQLAESVTPTSEWNRFLRTKYSIIVLSFLYDDNVYPRKGLEQVSKHVQTMWAVEFCNAVVIQSVVDTRPIFFARMKGTEKHLLLIRCNERTLLHPDYFSYQYVAMQKG